MGAQLKHFLLERGIRSMELNTPATAIVLVDILKCNSDLGTIKEVTEQLQFLSEDPSVLQSIYRLNGIPVLVKLLNATDESVSLYAVKILRNLLLGQLGFKEAVWKSFGLQKMVMTLKNNNEIFLSIVTECLHLLAYKNPENKLVVYHNDGPAELVRIMETYSCKTLLRTTASVLLVLSVCTKNKHAIIAAGGVQALAKHLYNSCHILVINCLLTLRNLSDAAIEQENVAPLLKTLVQFLKIRNKYIVCYAVGILANLTCNNPHNKQLICLERGVRALVNIILMFRNNEEIIEPAVRALFHLTNHHPEAENAQNGVRLNFGLEAIVRCLNPPIRWPLIKAVIALVGNLTLSPDNQGPLLALGIENNLRDLRHSIYQDILKNRESLPFSEIQPTVIDGVEMEDIIELIEKVVRNLDRIANIKTLVMLQKMNCVMS